MAREEKRCELKPVDDELDPATAVVRLESDETLQRPKPVRLGVPPEQATVSQRLELPAKDGFEIRTHQPGIDALIEAEMADPHVTEQDWGKLAAEQKHLPWGWFALVFLILGTAAVWSLSGVKNAEVPTTEGQVVTASNIDKDATEEREATQMIDRINQTTRKFFDAKDISQLAKLVRHSERVEPLMQTHYRTKPLTPVRMVRSISLQPMTLDYRANFWLVTVELADKTSRSLMVEILGDGEPRIDWESFVCQQPMAWDQFAAQRPAGRSFDFRVYVTQDNFFSHEFSESAKWSCFRLTARESDGVLFGYAKMDSAISKQIRGLLTKNRGQQTAMILRLIIPEGIQSRSGVVIEKVISPRWLYLDAPEV